MVLPHSKCLTARDKNGHTPLGMALVTSEDEVVNLHAVRLLLWHGNNLKKVLRRDEIYGADQNHDQMSANQMLIEKRYRYR